MNNQLRTHERSSLTVAVLAALGLTSGSVLATPTTFGNITLDAAFALGNASGPGADGIAVGSLSHSTDGADFFLNQNDAIGDNVFFHTYGYSAPPPGVTSFGARASGQGTFFGTTRATYNATVSNDTGVAQAYTFSFNVAGGNLGITGLGEGLADLLLAVKVDNKDIAHDHTTIAQNAANVVTCTDDNLGTLGAYAECGSPTANAVFGAGGLFTVALGLLDPGQQFTLNYDIIATVSGNLNSGGPLGCNGGGGEGLLARQALLIVDGGCAGAIARSGDPFDGPIIVDANGVPVGNLPPSFDPIIRRSPTNPVPEPGTLFLVGAGIVGLAGAKRRKARNPS